MLKKSLAVVLGGLLLNVASLRSVTANPKAEKEARFAEKVRSGIHKLGIGPEARVEVKLKDDSKLKGYISEANDTSFVVTDGKSGVATTIPYPQVKQVRGNNLSRAEVGSIVIGATFVFLLVLLAHSK